MVPIASTRAAYREALDSAFRPTRRNRLHWAVSAAALGVLVVLTVVLWDGQIYGWEQSITRYFQDVPGHETIFDVASTLTNTFSVRFLLFLLAIVATLILLDQRAAALLLILTVPLPPCTSSSDFPSSSSIGPAPHPSSRTSTASAVCGAFRLATPSMSSPCTASWRTCSSST